MDELLIKITKTTPLLKEYIANALISIIKIDQYNNIEDFKWLFTIIKSFVLYCPSKCEENLAKIIRVSLIII